MKLCHADNLRPVGTGDIVADARFERYVVQEIEPPRHAGGTGKVYVTPHHDPDGKVHSYEPAKFGLEWRADQ